MLILFFPISRFYMQSPGNYDLPLQNVTANTILLPGFSDYQRATT